MQEGRRRKKEEREMIVAKQKQFMEENPNDELPEELKLPEKKPRVSKAKNQQF